MTYTTTTTALTYTTSYAPRTPISAGTGSQTTTPKSDQTVKIKVTAATTPTFTTSTNTSSTRGTTVTFTNTQSSKASTSTSTTTSNTSTFTSFTTTIPKTTSSSSTHQNTQTKNSVKDAFYTIFYQKIEELIEIVDKYPLNDSQGNQLRVDRVSVQLSKWILDVIDAHAPASSQLSTPSAPKLSDIELQKDVIERLQKLACILVEDMHNTPTKKPLLDRKKHVWDHDTYDEWIKLSRLAVKALKINQFRFVDRVEKGITKKVEVILSPIDNEPMEMRHHSFAKAVVAWYYSLPWDLILSPEEFPPNPTHAEAETKVFAESSVVVSEPDVMTMDQMLRFWTYQGKGPAVRVTLNNLERTERTNAATKKLEQDAEKLKADRIAADKNTRKQLNKHKQAYQRELNRVNAAHNAAEAARIARETILKSRLEEDAKRISTLEIEDKRKQQQINGLASAVSSANASAQAAWAHANSIQPKVVTVHKGGGCSLQ